MSRLFEGGKPKYEWVSVKEDLPPDDPKNPGQSIVVKVKAYGLSWTYYEAYYVEDTGKWYNTKTGAIIGGNRRKNNFRPEVLYWTSDY